MICQETPWNTPRVQQCPTSLLLFTISTSNRFGGVRNSTSQIWDALPRYRNHRFFRPCRRWEFPNFRKRGETLWNCGQNLRERSGYEITFSNSGVWQSVNFQAKQAGVAPAGNKLVGKPGVGWCWYFVSIDSCSNGQSCVGYGVCLFNPQHQRTVGDEVLAEPRTSGIPTFATMCKWITSKYVRSFHYQFACCKGHLLSHYAST